MQLCNNSIYVKEIQMWNSYYNNKIMLGENMNLNKYKNIQLTKQIDEANCITHSGKFHVDDVISTIFLSKIIEKVILLRVSSVENKNLENKIVYDIGLRRIRSSSKK